jgi:hypothetical protein
MRSAAEQERDPMTSPTSDLAKLRVPRLRFRSSFPPLEKDHAAALGQVAASWSILEGFCEGIIHFLLDLDGELRFAVTGEMSYLAQINTVGAMLFAARDQELFDHWSDLTGIMNKLRTQRNDLIHGQWEPGLFETALSRAKARGRVRLTKRTVTVAEIIDLETRIIDAVDQLAWFSHQIARRGFRKTFEGADQRPMLDPTRTPATLAQSQSRQAKMARKEASRAHPSSRPNAAVPRA